MPIRPYFAKLEELATKMDKFDYKRQHVISFMDQFPNICYIKNAETFRYEFINEAGARIVGMDPKEVVGKVDGDLFSYSSALVMRRHDLAVLQYGPQTVIETWPERHDGRKTFLVTKFVIVNGARSIGGVGLEIPDQYKVEKQD